MKSQSGDFDVCAGPSGDAKSQTTEKPTMPVSKPEPGIADSEQPAKKRGRTGWFNPLLDE